MSRFCSELQVKLLGQDNDRKWELISALVYYSDLLKKYIVVPAGFVTDFASVPRLPVVFWLTGDTSDEAAVIHDWLYTTGEVSRADADAVLKEASEVTGVNVFRRTLMWLGVRIGGSSHYKSN